MARNVRCAWSVALLVGAGATVGQGVDERALSPAVAEVLVVNQRLNAAALSGDTNVLGEILSEEVVVSDPGNRIRRRGELMAIFASRTVGYRSIDVDLDFAEEIGDLVVLMGTEATVIEAVPEGAPWRAGDLLRRRFTNVYRRESGGWRLIVKQSTALPPSGTTD